MTSVFFSQWIWSHDKFRGTSRIDANTSSSRRWKATTTGRRIGIKRAARTKTIATVVSDPLTTTATTAMMTTAAAAAKKMTKIPVSGYLTSLWRSHYNHRVYYCCADPDWFFNFHFVADEDDDDEEIDRLTCWVCERAFRYIDLFFFKYIFIQSQLIGFHFSSTRILERHKIRERHFGWVGHFLSLPKNRVILAKHDTPLVHIYIRPHLFSPVSFSSPHPSLNPTLVMERSMMELQVAALVDETYVYTHVPGLFIAERKEKSWTKSTPHLISTVSPKRQKNKNQNFCAP